MSCHRYHGNTAWRRFQIAVPATFSKSVFAQLRLHAAGASVSPAHRLIAIERVRRIIGVRIVRVLPVESLRTQKTAGATEVPDRLSQWRSFFWILGASHVVDAAHRGKQGAHDHRDERTEYQNRKANHSIASVIIAPSATSESIFT